PFRAPPWAPGAAPVTVVVTNPDSQSATLANGFLYVGPTAPTITGVAPTNGSTTGGTVITITGTNLAPGATVTLGGTDVPAVTVVSATTITATTPAHAAGAVNVVVTNPDRQSVTLVNGFTYLAPRS